MHILISFAVQLIPRRRASLFSVARTNILRMFARNMDLHLDRVYCVLRSVFQDLPEPNRAWLLGNRSLTPVASGRPLVYEVT